MIKIKNTGEEKYSIRLFNEYGIAEWEEKSELVKLEDLEVFYQELEQGSGTMLDLFKMPFPKFVEEYFKKNNVGAKELKDPAFGYKFYLLSSVQRKYLSLKIMYPTLKDIEIKRIIGGSTVNYGDIEQIILPEFEQVLRYNNYPGIKTASYKKLTNKAKLLEHYIYISQYIDAEAAKRLGLRSFTYYANHEYRGFDLEGKLNALNEPIRTLVKNRIGYGGRTVKSSKVLSDELGIKAELISKFLLAELVRSTGELKSKLGYINKDYSDGSAIEYTNKTYRNMDIDAQISYLEKFVLSENEKEALNLLPTSKKRAFMARKYIYTSNESVINNLSLPLNLSSELDKAK